MEWAIQDGKRIHITKYNREAGELICADPQCCAKLYYQPQSIDQNGHVTSQKFASVSRAGHRDACTELQKELFIFEASLPLKQAVLAGHVIILSLNDLFGLPPQLWRDFGDAAHARHLNTSLNDLKNDSKYPDGRKGHRSESVKSASDLIRVINLIHKHGGDSALYKTFITWQHNVMSFTDFYLKGEDKQKEHFKALYIKARAQSDFYAVVNDQESMAYSVPYLRRFCPSKRTSEGDVFAPQSRPITLVEHQKTKKLLFLQQQINFPDGINSEIRTGFARDQWIVGVSRVVASRVMPVMQKFSFNNLEKPMFVYEYLDIMGDHQCLPAVGRKVPALKPADPILI